MQQEGEKEKGEKKGMASRSRWEETGPDWFRKKEIQ